jgi:hypothetical protein
MNTQADILFELTVSGLYVANRGKPFDRRGVISVCRENLSAKTQRGPIDDFPCSNEALISKIRARRLKIYTDDPDQLTEDANLEEETKHDYAGRFVWELLQNADDALAPANTSSADLIGAKGLGFKSVLEVTSTPEIHSGQFHFKFDPALAAVDLASISAGSVHLTFRLPYHATPDAVTERLLAAGYATVVKLSFSDKACRRAVIRRLKDFSPETLLLAQHLSSVEITGGELESTRFSVEGVRSQNARNERASLKVKSAGVEKDTEWGIWRNTWPAPDATAKRLSVCIGLPLEHGVATPVKSELPIHVFFPTEESCSARFLVHGAFTVRQDRNHFREDKFDSELLDKLADVVKVVVSDLPPTSTALLFDNLVASAPSGKPRNVAKRIHATIAKGVKASAFVPTIGGGYVRPENVRLWKYELGSVINHKSGEIASMSLASSEMTSVFENLKAFGATLLTPAEYAAALVHAKCLTPADCITAANIVVSASKQFNARPEEYRASLLQAPIWPTSDGSVRCLRNGRAFLEFHPADWPDWLPHDELEQSFKSALLKADGWHDASLAKLTEGIILRSRRDWLLEGLGPYVNQWTADAWHRHGWSALKTILRWTRIPDWIKIAPFVSGFEEDKVRARLVETIKLPAGTDWVTANCCYADRSIGGAPGLARFMRGQRERFVIGMPRAAKKLFSELEWKGLLRYLGVCWEPRIQYVAGDSTEGVGAPNETEYRAHLNRENLRYRNRDWYLEFFPECLAKVSARDISRMIVDLVSATKGLKCIYKKQWGSATSYYTSQYRALVQFQLKNESYIPCRPTPIHPSPVARPADLYWHTCAVSGVTPTIDLGQVPKSRREEAQNIFIDELGVHDELPTDLDTWRHWAEAYANFFDKAEKPPKERAVRDFYERLLASVKDSDAVAGETVRVICKTSLGLGSVSANEAIWIDDARLVTSEVENALINAGLAVFPPLLDRGKGADEILEVHRASQRLALTPKYTETLSVKTETLDHRLRVRYSALAAVCETKSVRLHKLPKLIVVRDLKLLIEYGGQQIAAPSTSSFRSADGWLISGSVDLWEAVAAALAEDLSQKPDLKIDLKYRFAAVLRARQSEVSNILMNDGIPPYRAREISLESGPEPADTSIGQSVDEDGEVEGDHEGILNELISNLNPHEGDVDSKREVKSPSGVDTKLADSPKEPNSRENRSTSFSFPEISEVKIEFADAPGGAIEVAFGDESVVDRGRRPWIPPSIQDVERDREVGRRGEELAFRHELDRVRALGKPAPESLVIWTSELDPGADHDIRTIDENGRTRWIEVKSTTGTDGIFEWSKNEFQKALRAGRRYELWRVYKADSKHPIIIRYPNPIKLLGRKLMKLDISKFRAKVGSLGAT